MSSSRALDEPSKNHQDSINNQTNLIIFLGWPAPPHLAGPMITSPSKKVRVEGLYSALPTTPNWWCFVYVLVKLFSISHSVFLSVRVSICLSLCQLGLLDVLDPICAILDSIYLILSIKCALRITIIKNLLTINKFVRTKMRPKRFCFKKWF